MLTRTPIFTLQNSFASVIYEGLRHSYRKEITMIRIQNLGKSTATIPI